jgi:hypothetical protein
MLQLVIRSLFFLERVEPLPDEGTSLNEMHVSLPPLSHVRSWLIQVEQLACDTGLGSVEVF